MKVTLIYNCDAGVDDQPSERDILELIRDAGNDVHEVSLTDACWEEAIRQPVDVVAVAGGDGTVGQVVKCLMRAGTPIAVLPVGTANNIAKTLGLMDQPLNQLIAHWKSARRVRFDVGTATGPWGSKYFVEGIGIGLFTGTMSRLDATGNIEIAHCDNPEEKMTSVLDILDRRLSTYPAQALDLTLDGEPVSGAYILLEILNTPFVGPNLLLAPKADAGDGLFDIVFLSAGQRPKFGRYLNACMRRKSSTPRWPVRRASHIRMEWKGFAVHIDDEVWPDKGGAFNRSSMTIEVTVNRRAVEFLAR